jgi:CubicO group peptidase (beta-lactamase class C family)
LTRFYFKTLLIIGVSFIFYACNDRKKEPKIEKLSESERAYNKKEFEVKEKKIAQYFEHLHKQTGFNGAVWISKDEHKLYAGAFGFNDIKHQKEPINISSVFQLASVSKQFTAAAILHLMEQGKLKLSDPIQKFYPNFPYQGINIKMLLLHRGGLGNYTYFSEMYCDRKTPISNQDVVQMMIKNKPPIYFFPDRRFDYSNTGYVLLAAIIEKVTAEKFDVYMRKEIFKPLGMNHTYVYDINKPAAFNYSPGHDKNLNNTQKSYLDGAHGDKGVYSSVEDLAIWDRVLYSNIFLKKSSIDSLSKPGNHHLTGPFNYGYGWRTYTLADRSNINYHGGWWNGYKTFFFRDLKNHHAIILLSNREHSGFRDLDGLVDIIYDRKPDPKRKYSVYMHHAPGY